MQSMVVWLVVAQPMNRADLRSCIERNGFELTVERATIKEMMGCGDRALRSPNLIVLDCSQGTTGFKMLKAAQPRARIVVLAESIRLSQLADTFAAGADGYLPMSIAPSALITSLRLVAMGEKVFPSTLTDVLRKMQSAQAGVDEYVRIDGVMLSRRELEVIRRLTDGQSNGTIAAELEIAEATVKVHVKRVLRKLGATNNREVAAWVAQHGIQPRQREADRVAIAR